MPQFCQDLHTDPFFPDLFFPLFSTDGGSTFGTTITGATLGDFTAYDHTIPEYLVTTQTKQFTQQTGVDAIQLSNIYVFDGALADRVAIMEMRFDSVPEPSAALLGGFGALLLLRRRRHA